MPEHPLVLTQPEKIAFQKKCKFSIAFDSVRMPGFVTEKILHAFAAKTIPIYFGDPHIDEQFNKKSFIDVADYDFDLERVLEKIIEIDQNDDLYLDMLQQPAFVHEDFIDLKRKEFENFIYNIFDQDNKDAFRRSTIAAPKAHEERLKEYNRLSKSRVYGLLKRFFDYI